MIIRTPEIQQKRAPHALFLRLKRDPLPLEAGERLTRHEFERRYDAMPHIKKAELIEGVVYMPSPVHYEGHSEPYAYIAAWLVTYSIATPGARPADNATVQLDMDNEVQPDVLLRLDPVNGGRSHITDKDYIEGPPELVVEVAASSTSIDLRDKYNIYRRNGVQEYLVWQVYDDRIDWFRLDQGEYLPLLPDESGVICSRVFPGLQLDGEALLDGNLPKVLAMLQQGIQTPEYAAFVERLKSTSSAQGT